jgi:hypothetical protein
VGRDDRGSSTAGVCGGAVRALACSSEAGTPAVARLLRRAISDITPIRGGLRVRGPRLSPVRCWAAGARRVERVRIRRRARRLGRGRGGRAGEDPVDVRLHGGLTGDEVPGDLGVGESVSDQAQDFRFAFRERAQFGGLRAGPRPRTYSSIRRRATVGARSASPEATSRTASKAGRRGALEQEAAGAGLERGVGVASREGSTLRPPSRRVHLPQRYTCAITRSSP